MALGLGRERIGRFVKRSLSRIRRTSPSAAAPQKRREYSIGIYVGHSPFDFVAPPDLNNPILTCADVSDVPAILVADPFMIRVDQLWYMFFEVMNRQAGKGEIGLAISDNGFQWAYQQIVLAEPFHLSYPYVFEWMGEYYMIPESHKASAIRLYKASKFPTEWSLIRTLLAGASYIDGSIVRYDNKWWLFAETSPEMKHDTLRLYYSNDLLGPWSEHTQSPIIDGDPHTARPAGRVLVLNDRLVRYAQDCYPNYGVQVRAFEVTELTNRRYREQEVSISPILTGSGAGWNQSGMHHIDPHLSDDGRWIACVDGWLKVDALNCTAKLVHALPTPGVASTGASSPLTPLKQS